MSNFSIKKPYTIFVGVILVIILGIISFMNLSTDLLPSLELPYVAIITTYVGASPEKVEESVSKVIEQGMMGISNIENVTSTSSENYSMVLLEFSGDSDMNSIMIEISQELDLLESNFEEGIAAPIVMQINPDMMPVLMSAVDKENTNVTELTTFINTKIIPELESVDGVASVDLYGEVEDQIKITLNQSKIDAVNDKVLSKVSSTLYKTKKELDDAKAKINDGQAELDKTKAENNQKIADGLAQVESGRNELTKAEIAMDYDNNYKKATEAKSELEKNLAEVTKNETELNTALSALNLDIESKQAEVLAKTEQKSALEAILSNPESTPEEIESATSELTELETSITGLNAALQVKNEQATNLGSTLAGITEGKKQLQAGLTQASSGIEQLTAGKQMLDQKKEELNAAAASLEMAQSTFVSETTKASVQLETAKSQLESGLEQFNAARDEAYKQASLDGIITASLISNILAAENFSMPAGYIQDDILVKIGDKFNTIDEIQNLVIFSFDIKGLEEVKLSDLADIEVTTNKDDVYTKINRNDGLVLSFSKQSTASTKEVSEAVQKKMEELTAKYPDMSFTNLMDQGVYIDMIIGSVMQSLLMGAVLAVIILYIFLKEFKPTLIVAISIPISLVFAVTLMYFTGVSINIMSLSGLALGVGMLVDNSIVVVENIYRLKKEGKEIKEACIEGAEKVTGAIIASTLTTVCVFLPIVFVHGLSRQLFSDIGLTIAYSLIASLITALTVVPAFSSKLLTKVNDKENKSINFLTKVYAKTLEWSLKFKFVVIILVLALVGLSLYLMTIMEIEFIPNVASDQIEVSFEMSENAKQEELHDMSNQIIERIVDIEGIQKIGAMDMGSSGTGIMSMGSGSGVQMYIILDEERTKTNDDIASQIKENTKDLNCEVTVNTSTMDMSSMMASGISLSIKGNDINKLKEIGRDIETKLSGIEGIGEIEGVDSNTKTTQKFIDIDKNKAMKYGLTIAQVYQAVAGELSREIQGANVTLDNKEYKLLIEKPEDSKLTLDNIMEYELKGKENNEEVTIKLYKIATMTDEETLDTIKRENNNRYVTVTAKIAEGYSTTQVSRTVENTFKNYEAPEGYEVSIDGEMDSVMEYISDLLLMLLVAISFIYLIMVAQFQSFKLPFIVMFTMPLAFTGGIIGLFVTGQSISIIAMLGFLVLAGIVVNNGIVFIDSINQLREEGMERKEAIITTGKLRLRPILMTALTTILGMLTMALGIGKGSEMSQPLGIVTISGLLYSTLLTLYLCPVLYEILCKKTIIKSKKD